MWFFLIISLLITFVKSDELFQTSFSITDQCINLCKESQLPALDLENYEQVVCQRGCRFFNIIRFKDELNINTTRKECHLSCEESYVLEPESRICKSGCELMAKKRQIEMSSFLILTQEDDSNNIVLAEPDLEILESDLLSDPSIKSQLEIGFNIDYKIPETHIRTMPIEFKDDLLKGKDVTGDWLDCASRNSGIPRWFLLSAILSAVLIALWLSFMTDKRSGQEHDDVLATVDISDEKLILDDDDDEEDVVVEKDPKLLESTEEDINFSAPPKYSLESETV